MADEKSEKSTPISQIDQIDLAMLAELEKSPELPLEKLFKPGFNYQKAVENEIKRLVFQLRRYRGVYCNSSPVLAREIVNLAVRYLNAQLNQIPEPIEKYKEIAQELSIEYFGTGEPQDVLPFLQRISNQPSIFCEKISTVYVFLENLPEEDWYPNRISHMEQLYSLHQEIQAYFKFFDRAYQLCHGVAYTNLPLENKVLQDKDYLLNFINTLNQEYTKNIDNIKAGITKKLEEAIKWKELIIQTNKNTETILSDFKKNRTSLDEKLKLITELKTGLVQNITRLAELKTFLQTKNAMLLRLEKKYLDCIQTPIKTIDEKYMKLTAANNQDDSTETQLPDNFEYFRQIILFFSEMVLTHIQESIQLVIFNENESIEESLSECNELLRSVGMLEQFVLKNNNSRSPKKLAASSPLNTASASNAQSLSKPLMPIPKEDKKENQSLSLLN